MAKKVGEEVVEEVKDCHWLRLGHVISAIFLTLLLVLSHLLGHLLWHLSGSQPIRYKRGLGGGQGEAEWKFSKPSLFVVTVNLSFHAY